jgi:beta-lactam-binding protein with PASTA domain
MRRSTYFLLGLVAVAALGASGCGERSAERAVTIPKTAASTDADSAYDVLHGAGLRVAVSSASTHWPNGSSIVSSIKPRVGSAVPPGSVVTVTVDGAFLASPTIPRGRIPAATEPDFSAASLSAVASWAQKHGLYWQCRRLPAFPASSRPHLLDNYVVVHQSPAAGATLRRYKPLHHGVHLTPLLVQVAVRPAG